MKDKKQDGGLSIWPPDPIVKYDVIVDVLLLFSAQRGEWQTDYQHRPHAKYTPTMYLPLQPEEPD